MKVNCPNCRNPLELPELSDTNLEDLDCPSCGSRMSLIDETLAATQAQRPRQIGHFELTQILGSGAFGTVWKARDKSLDRIVAVKIPRQGNLEEEQARMFLREAQSAAQLNHPNIVGVHEVGRDDGTLYIVSDFIDGVTLSDWLSANRPSFQESAQLIVEVARALQAAHAAGIVHRDLKPGNIMIDRDGRPFVMDFGLAKRESHEITMTADGAVLGTPAYMSPEQAAGDARQADARSDVYSLGVILYELLSGERPFRGTSRMLLQQVIHDEPPPLRRLNNSIPRDLETICATCLAKSPERRYTEAGGLADDLQRWLDRVPILARPATRLERGVRWCQRYPVPALMAATIHSVFMIGFVSVVYQWSQSQTYLAEAREQRTIAETERIRAERQAEIAEENRRQALAASAEAQNNLEDTQEAVDTFLTSVAQSRQLRSPGMMEVRMNLLRMARNHYMNFASRSTWDNRLMLTELAAAFRRVAYLENQMGHYDRAERAFLASISTCRKLHQASPENGPNRSYLATSLSAMAHHLSTRQRMTEAADYYRRALELHRGLLDEFPGEPIYLNDVASTCNGLGYVLGWMGRRDEAHELYEEARRLRTAAFERNSASTSRRASLARDISNVGYSLNARGDLRAAEVQFAEALETVEPLLTEWPDNIDYRNIARLILENEVVLFTDWSRYDEAREKLDALFEIVDSLATEEPNILEYRRQAAYQRVKNADLVARMEGRDEALRLADEALQLAEGLLEDVPDSPDYRWLRAQALAAQARHSESQDTTTPDPRALEALQILEGMVAEYPDLWRYRDSLTRQAAEVARRSASRADDPGVPEAFETARQSLRELADREAAFEYRTRTLLAETTYGLGRLLERNGEVEASKNAGREAAAEAEDALRLLPEDSPFAWKVYRIQGLAYLLSGDHPKALAGLQRALDASPATDVSVAYGLALAHHGLDDAAEARTWLRAAAGAAANDDFPYRQALAEQARAIEDPQEVTTEDPP